MRPDPKEIELPGTDGPEQVDDHLPHAVAHRIHFQNCRADSLLPQALSDVETDFGIPAIDDVDDHARHLPCRVRAATIHQGRFN
jgi:hypothetical protein